MEKIDLTNKLSLQEIEGQIAQLEAQKKLLTGKEPFSWKKLTKDCLDLFNPVGWAKWFISTFKTVLVLGIVCAILFGFGYFKGKQSKPVFVELKDFKAEVTCVYDKEGRKHILEGRGNVLYFDGKPITEKDVPALKQYGIELHPKLFMGVGKDGPAIGVGAELAHFYKFNLDAFVMSDKSAYLGISYDLKLNPTDIKVKRLDWLDNSSIGLAVGKGLEDMNDNRIMLYWSLKF